ncbi:hypothetical protein [Tsuneonella mangrovi]|uniref:hypothetical protein n=1 Tax=Tsuneonella mangrovi TaxID=1982042 RepID=UPI000BA20562|nr:hypothetical protein [Tsuneonella mangrovi]
MTIQTALARSNACSPIARAMARKATGRAANDNGIVGHAGTDDQLLHAALRHFGEHGLRAADEARKLAEAAFFSGDRQSYNWWLGICSTLDRRLASRTMRKLTHI